MGEKNKTWKRKERGGPERRGFYAFERRVDRRGGVIGGSAFGVRGGAMFKLSRALRVVVLSALMLVAVLAEDAALDLDAAEAAVEAAAKGLETAKVAALAAEAAAADKEREEEAAVAVAAAAEAAGAAAAAAAAEADVPDVAVEVEPVAAAAAAAPAPKAQDGDGDAQDGDGDGDGDEDESGAGNGLYFFVNKKGPMRCFVINQGAKSVFHVHYHFPEADEGKEVRLELRSLPLQGPRRKRLDQKPITTRKITTQHGSHEFKLAVGGAHSLCAATDSDHGVRGLRLFLHLDTGRKDDKIVTVKEKFNLDDMQISMIQLKNRAKALLREADFAKTQETKYHKNVLRLNREVLWWPISQVVMLLIMGFFQVRHLKKFFKNKRLV